MLNHVDDLLDAFERASEARKRYREEKDKAEHPYLVSDREVERAMDKLGTELRAWINHHVLGHWGDGTVSDRIDRLCDHVNYHEED